MSDQQNGVFKILTIVLALALVASLAAILILVKGVSSQKETQPSDQVSSLSPEKAYELKQEAKAACAKQVEDNDFAQSNCLANELSQKAISSQSEAACSLIEDVSLQTNCKDNIYRSKALSASPDPSACTKISDETQRTPCANESNYYLAKLNPDKATTYCNKITSDSLKALCLEKFAK